MQVLETIKGCEGLSAEEVLEARQKHGENILPRAKRRSFLLAFVKNLGDPVIKILLCALLVDVLLLFRSGDVWETVGIAVSVGLATLISTVSERGSERAFEKLEASSGDGRCRVRRREGICEISFSEVCVGDIVMISAGEEVPADGVLILGRVGLDMSSMTGESREVEKLPSESRELAPYAPSSMLRGARAVSGEGEMKVLAVGGETMLGSISREVQLDTRESPLKMRLRKLARQISIIGYISAAFVAIAYLANVFLIDSSFSGEIILSKLSDPHFVAERLLEAFMIGLTVVVMAVPEGLPMMIAVVLSSNVHRMARGGVLVKKPVGIEAAGSMDLLFTDKTGTLTEGEMRLFAVIASDGEAFDGYGGFLRSRPREGRLAMISAEFNSSSAFGKKDGRVQVIGGNPTDRGLLLPIKKPQSGVKVIKKIPFDSARKFSAVEVEADGEHFCIYKGAPEYILAKCVGNKRDFRRAIAENCAKGARAVAIALRRGALPEKATVPESLELVCGVLLRDPVRKNARAAIERLRGAGIQTVMVTGDSRDTAEAIAQECGVLSGRIDRVLDSDEMKRMSDAEIAEILPRLGVVARALPTDKSRLVRIAQGAGRVTGMTGDGINDAPALRAADVGFAMGCGNAVAKDAGDVVILSNDLDGIANAVLYGRNIFKSIRKFICLQLTVNFSAVGVSMAGPFIGIDAPVTVVQMLWLNIIMDTLGGLAFAGEAAEERIMREKPKSRGEEILSPYMRARITFLGLFSLALSLFFLCSDRVSAHFAESAGEERMLTGFFAFFVFLGLFNCFNSRSDRLNLFSGLTKNPLFVLIMCSVAFVQLLFTYLGGSILRTVPLSAAELWFSLSMALAALPAGVLHTFWRRLRGKRDGF